MSSSSTVEQPRLRWPAPCVTRFASVYRAFGSVEDFEREIQMLRTEREVQDFEAEHPVEALGGTD